jgi:hypothetical protein
MSPLYDGTCSLGRILRSSVSLCSGFLVLMRPSRLEILWTWTSTTRAGCPKPYSTTAFAVFLPTPGRESRSSILFGTWPPNLSTRSLLISLMRRALVL